MEQLNIAVCEDDRADARHLCALIAASAADASVTVFENGEAFLAACQPDRFDLIFMDIYLDGINGVEAVRQLRERDEAVPVAFTTASPDFTRESYLLDVARYVDKPVSQREVDKMLALARSRRAEREKAVLQWGRRDPVRVPILRLRYVEQREHALAFHLTGGGVLTRRGRLDDLEPLLAGHPFFRCHKSYLVNLAFVQDMDQERMLFLMREGGSVYIRREAFSRAREMWESWLFSAARRKGERP